MKTAIVFLFAVMCAGQVPQQPVDPSVWSGKLQKPIFTVAPVAEGVRFMNQSGNVAQIFLHDKEKLMEIYDAKGAVVFTIFLDGHVVSASGQPADEETKAFWKAFAEAFPELCKEPKP